MIKIASKKYISEDDHKVEHHRRRFFKQAPFLANRILNWSTPEGGFFAHLLHKLHVNDRLILEWFHNIEVGILVFLLGCISLVQDKQALEPIAQIILIFVLGMGYYRVYLFKKLNDNLQAIVHKTKGKFITGNSVLSVPPQARFVYDHQDCHVLSTIDKYFRLVLEYHCYFGKEREFRIEKKFKKGRAEVAAYGENKDFYDKILTNPETRKNLEDILSNFSYLHYGKDGVMHVGEPFDGKLTEMHTVLHALGAMSSLGKALKLDG